MKNIFNIKTLLYVAVASFVLTSCTDDDYQKSVEKVLAVEVTSGSADFSKFVSVGNSLTAGFTDGALFIKGQENSIPNLTANKFAMAGGGNFTQPLMNDNNGGLLLGGTMIQGPRLYFNGAGPVPVSDAPTTEIIGSTSGPYNNMGVPGAKVTHLLYDGYGKSTNLMTNPPTANPYFVRMASAENATIINDAAGQNPTFFTLWIGSNDVLRYALEGADDTLESITPTATFDYAYGLVANALTVNGAKGVLLNLPDVTATPHFTTIPYNAFDADNPDQAAYADAIPGLNGLYGQLNPVFQYLGHEERMVSFSATGKSPIVIFDESLEDLSASISAVLQANGVDAGTAYVLSQQFKQSRQATSDDLLTLSSKSILGQFDQAHYDALVGLGVPAANATQLSMAGLTYPLVDKWVLLPSEQTAIQAATDAYNATIQAVAIAKDLAFVDVNTVMNDLANGGLPFDEFTMTSQYIFGNTFSLDGVHPTERGNAFLSNEILKAIDTKYGSNFEASGNLNKAADFVTQYPATIQ